VWTNTPCTRTIDRDTIRLLSDFDEDLFTYDYPNKDLAVYMEGLGLLGTKNIRELGTNRQF